jgi:hypothetical protein
VVGNTLNLSGAITCNGTPGTSASGSGSGSASSSGTAADVKRQLLRLLAALDCGVSEEDILTVLGRVQRNEDAVDAVIAGVTEWQDTSGKLLIPVAMQGAAKRFLAMLDV